MKVYEDGILRHTWPVSTAREGYVTPAGSYRPYLLDKDHHSRKYDDAPMPYSVFYSGGFAIHGTTSTRALGRRASHGCVRLDTANARTFYALVAAHGLSATHIVIKGEPSLERRSARTEVVSRQGLDQREVGVRRPAVERIVLTRTTATTSREFVVARRVVHR